MTDHVTAVKWSTKSNYVGIGTFSGDVQIWDSHAGKCLRTLGGHTGRVGSIALSNSVVWSGSRDKTIIMRDLRCPEANV